MHSGDRQNDMLFEETTDPGEKDGGVHDWIGRAQGDQFIGFYTSAHHTGFFRLKRTPATPAPNQP